jgi:hypothetical protein
MMITTDPSRLSATLKTVIKGGQICSLHKLLQRM